MECLNYSLLPMPSGERFEMRMKGGTVCRRISMGAGDGRGHSFRTLRAAFVKQNAVGIKAEHVGKNVLLRWRVNCQQKAQT